MTNKQVKAEAVPFFFKYTTFHINRVAYHGRQSMPPTPITPIDVGLEIKDVVLWGDVAYRVATDPNWYARLTAQFSRLQLIKLNLEWGDQQTRSMSRTSMGTKRY
jgi:hypothetical protein